ncbi:TetR/AcrR family transcriptional regulator [Longimicrobium sp.]|uniref:TetR/AcrR family transcriptional regulator n=1 Tax=Longimicrobium sp. TaxID=2029185 RepID=UPI002E3509A7|nr:TetR/AcrR family transcriptional regulator [Longimicrobium sp.]HEX6039767.1 TetR/AcrR family transcriptional regulator [Longimicrobium sp.]
MQQPWTESGLRAATLDTTRTLLVRDGYENLSMRKIARQVGCSVSSIYEHFAGKDQLVHALIDEGFSRWYEVVQEAAEAPGTPAERLALHCRRYVEFGLENPEFYEIMYMLRPRFTERFPRESFRRATRSMDVLSRLVHEAAPGAFPGAEEARIHAHVVWALLHGVVSTIVASRLDVRIDQAAYVDSSIQFAVDAVRRMEPAGV